MSVDIRKINWRKNPVQAQDDIEHNFNALAIAFDDLATGKIQRAKLAQLSADSILSGSTDLSDLFESKYSQKLVEGNNITIRKSSDGNVLEVSKNPSFERIYSGSTDLSSIFISRKDVRDTIRPKLGRNLGYSQEAEGLVLEVLSSPHFEALTSDSMSATSAQFETIIYKGRPLDEHFPSHKLPDSAPYLTLKRLDWGSNPNATRNDINENYDLIARAFNSLLQHKLNDVQLVRVVADEVILNGKNLNDLYLPKNADYDIVRIQAGSNIVTGGTQNRPIINLKSDPVFNTFSATTATLEGIILNGKNILDVFYTRKEASSLKHPELGDNLKLSKGENPKISVVSDPKFSKAIVDHVTAETISAKTIIYNGSVIEKQFGSHTFIKAGKNMVTAGTQYNPVVSVIDDPNFHSIGTTYLNALALTASTLTAQDAGFKNVTLTGGLKVSNNLVVDDRGIALASDMYLNDNRITIGGEPEREISSFLRTKVRILATESSPIHYALIVQKKEQEHKRVLNDDTVDFAIRGDGNVGIGSFKEITSRMTIKSDGGFDQLRLMNPFSPQNSNDERGATGNVTWDDGFIYVKTPQGWKRSSLELF